jgi:hypothetical protein
LWGASFSASHVIAIAATDPAVAAVVAQVPGLSASVGFLVRLMTAGLIDALHGLFGRPPYLRPVVGGRGEGAIIVDAQAESTLRTLGGSSSLWRNEVALRGIFTGSQPRPGKVAMPLLICVADQDRLAPPAAAIRAARRAPRGQLRRYPVGHFEFYLPPIRDEVIADQVDFLRTHLAPAGAGAPS